MTLQRCSDNVASVRLQHVAADCVVMLRRSHLALLLAERVPDGCYLLTIKTIVGLALFESSSILESVPVGDVLNRRFNTSP